MSLPVGGSVAAKTRSSQTLAFVAFWNHAEGAFGLQHDPIDEVEVRMAVLPEGGRDF
jgi:hypothetical protein